MAPACPCSCKPHQSLGAHIEHRWSCRDAALRECARTASTIRCIRCSALPGPCSRSSSSTSTGCCCRCFPARRRAGRWGRCTRPPRRRPSSALGSPRPSTPATPASPPRRRRQRIASPGVASRWRCGRRRSARTRAAATSARSTCSRRRSTAGSATSACFASTITASG